MTPTAGGPTVFIHISEFPRDGDRPTIGERLSVETDFGKGGKPRAVNVRRANCFGGGVGRACLDSGFHCCG
ncbi:MAG: cold shock domain-containing protein [Candidatus Competibacteraceae bacterium]|nr:cold shock domain-containing protein [Candidatus Competibacteraceae bacterium]